MSERGPETVNVRCRNCGWSDWRRVPEVGTDARSSRCPQCGEQDSVVAVTEPEQP